MTLCGVCGVVNINNHQVDPQIVATMMKWLAHRGPDDEGMWHRRNVGIGFRRLSILDLSGGHQPMTGEDSNIVSVVNGEIYNYRELRSVLQKQGHRFTSESDAEVVPHLYEQGGIDQVIQKIRGMFAVALWDARDESLYLIRDHFGIKPLYYRFAENTMTFSSEIKSLLSGLPQIPPVNIQAVWDYFTFQYVPDPLTMFEGVCELPAAHYLRLHDGKIQVQRYWELEFHPDPRLDMERAAERIREAMTDSVYRHKQSDVRWGAYLSSGIDSTLVVALLRKSQEVDTFSIGFSGKHREINELRLARDTAKALGTRHHEVEVDREEYQEKLPEIIVAQENPIADPSAPALYFLAREAKKFVTVILSGEGSDELFGGYPIYQEPLALKPFQKLPKTVRESLWWTAQKLPPGTKGRGYIQRGMTPLKRRFIGNAHMFSEEDKKEFLGADVYNRAQSSFRVTDPYYSLPYELDDPAVMQTVDCHTWLPGDILMKADKMSMAHSLELRVPFLDVEVFERVAKFLPLALRVNRATTKVALRKAAEGIVPEEVVNRPKLGFPIPIVDWIAGDMRPFIRDVFATVHPDFLDTGYFQGLLDSPQYVFNRDRKIWTGLVFLLWYRQFIAADTKFDAQRPISLL